MSQSLGPCGFPLAAAYPTAMRPFPSALTPGWNQCL